MRGFGFSLVLLLALGLLAGCGNKGDLVKPGQEPPAKKTATKQAPTAP